MRATRKVWNPNLRLFWSALTNLLLFCECIIGALKVWLIPSRWTRPVSFLAEYSCLRQVSASRGTCQLPSNILEELKEANGWGAWWGMVRGTRGLQLQFLSLWEKNASLRPSQASNPMRHGGTPLTGRYWQHFLAAGPRWSDDMPTYIYIYRERASTDIHSVMLNDITSKGTETFDGNEATADWTCPKENNELQTYWSIFNAARSKLLYTYVNVETCGDVRHVLRCCSCNLLHLSYSLVESNEFSAFRCSPELRALELQNLLPSSCMPQTSPRKNIETTYACTSVPAHNAKSAAALRIIHQ